MNTVGGNRNHKAALMITVQRDGTVSDVLVHKSTGTPAMDAALIRQFSRISGIPAFTPDMTLPSVSFPLSIGTRRG